VLPIERAVILTRLSTSLRAGRYWEGLVRKQRTGRNLFLKLHEEENMRKLISILVATVFAVSSGAALAASHAGAQPMKDDKKSEMKKGDKKADKKAKKTAKKDAKKDEMKK
jgi:hypothetical protein